MLTAIGSKMHRKLTGCQIPRSEQEAVHSIACTVGVANHVSLEVAFESVSIKAFEKAIKVPRKLAQTEMIRTLRALVISEKLSSEHRIMAIETSAHHTLSKIPKKSLILGVQKKSKV